MVYMTTKQERYYQKNRDRLLLYYQERNKRQSDYVNERYREKSMCYVCDEELSFGSFRTHNKSKKHLRNLKNASPRLIPFIQEEESRIRDEMIENFHNNYPKVVHIYTKYERFLKQKIKRILPQMKYLDTLNYSKLLKMAPNESHIDLQIFSVIFCFIKYHKEELNIKKIRKSIYDEWMNIYQQLPIDNEDIIRAIEDKTTESYLIETIYLSSRNPNI